MADTTITIDLMNTDVFVTLCADINAIIEGIEAGHIAYGAEAGHIAYASEAGHIAYASEAAELLTAALANAGKDTDGEPGSDCTCG